MAKIVLNDISNITGSETAALAALNENNSLIEAAIENTLSRDGTSPNAMNNDFDMNGYDFINVGNINGQDANDLVGPPGPPGSDGADGVAATVAVGSTTTLAAGSPATAVNVGTSSAAIINFGIPKGTDGVGAGSVTSVSVVSANGLAGTVATATSTPAITLSTTVTGVLKGNGTAISAATAGTDYYNPGGTDVAVADGGTNLSSYTVGDILYASGTTTLSKLAKGTAGQALKQNTALTAPEWTPSREVISANRTYYVRTDGSDSNDGLSNTSGGGFLTIQKALSQAATIDLNGFTLTIQVADGTYTGSNNIPVLVGQAITSGLTIQGNSGTPGNVIISTTSLDCFLSVAGSRALIKDMELRTTTGGYCIDAVGVGSELQFSNIRFGACANTHIIAQAGAMVTCVGDYAITGSAIRHVNSDRGLVEIGSKTITLTGTPAFSSNFVNASQGHVRMFLNTYSGSATGVRYSAVLNGTIQTFGAGTTALPGDSAGSTSTGGQYA